MNKLILKIYFLKYYDYIFLLSVFLIFAAVYICKMLLKGKWASERSKIFLDKLGGKKGQAFLLTLLLISGFLLRLYKIGNPIADWHSFRQADTASVTRLYLKNGLNLLLPQYHDVSTTQSGLFNPNGYRFVEFPIYNAFHLLLFRLAPFISLEIWGRLLSIFATLVSAYLIFLLAKRFISKSGGLVALFFFLFIPFNIYFSRVILPEPMAIAFALFSLWTFVKFIDKNNNFYLLASSSSLSISILIKPYAIFYLLPMAYLALKKWGFKRLLVERRFYIAALLVFMPFILWRIWMIRFPEGIPFWKWTFNGDDIRFKPAFWYWIFGERLTKLILGYLGLIPFATGILVYKKNKAFIHFFLLGMLFYVSLIATANVRHDYYQTLVIPSLSLTLASGTVYLWGAKEFYGTLRKSLIIVSIILMMGLGWFQVKEFYKINRPEIIKAGEAVQRLTPEDVLVIASYNGDTAFLYQTDRRGWPVVDRPINELIEKGAQYYVSVDLGHPQTQEFMKKFKVIEKTDQYVIIKLE